MNNLLKKAYDNFKDREGRDPNWEEVGCEMLKIKDN